MDREYKAATLFYEGYNCAQAVAMAFSDVIGLEEKFCAKAVSSFGGGMVDCERFAERSAV